MTTTMMMRSQQFHTNNQISHQIPTFGDWEYVNDLPITQYFESARAAGLIRYSNSSGECPAAANITTTTTDVPVLYDGFNYGGGGGGGGGYYNDGCNYGGYNGLGNGGGGGDLYAVDYDKKGFGVTGSGLTSYPVNKKKTRQVREKKCPPSGKEGIVGGVGARTKQYSGGGKVCDVTDLRRRYNTTNSKNYKYQYEAAETNNCRSKKQMQKNVVMVNVGSNNDDAGIKPRFAPPSTAAAVPRKQQPKAVDEDLYKIPPHLLRSSHRKKKLGFISRCLMPCAV